MCFEHIYTKRERFTVPRLLDRNNIDLDEISMEKGK
jgi:hypothetical protein